MAIKIDQRGARYSESAYKFPTENRKSNGEAKLPDH